MPDEEKQWFDLVKHNFQKPDPATTEVVKTVRGLGYAQRMAEMLTEHLTPEEKEAGFRVFQRKGTKPAGLDLRRRGRRGPDKRRNRRR